MNKSKFSDISCAKDLILYLKEPQRLNNIKYLCKYTTSSSVVDLFSTGMMLINNPANMNDLFEYRSFEQSRSRWDKICFASFISKSDENMAMWSMYAQPWRDGVMMSIPVAAIRELIRNTDKVFCAKYDKKENWYFPLETTIPARNALSISRIAYFSGTTISCTGRDDRNTHFSDPYIIPELMGYIKDSAWDYEKEVRLRVDLPNSYSSNAVFIQIPPKLLYEISLTTGPR